MFEERLIPDLIDMRGANMAHPRSEFAVAVFDIAGSG
jgi:hypothetical protein